MAGIDFGNELYEYALEPPVQKKQRLSKDAFSVSNIAEVNPEELE